MTIWLKSANEYNLRGYCDCGTLQNQFQYKARSTEVLIYNTASDPALTKKKGTLIQQ